jgi:SSS family solute:Na+ symporter
VILGMGLHTIEFARDNPQEAFLWIHAETGPVALGLLGVLITAASLGTVSGILNAMSTAISNDIAAVVRRDLSQRTALTIARWAVIAIGIGSLAAPRCTREC